ncbi:hypothetical protein [Paludibacterium purpuratum]|uniref:DUF4352 domain-containing protein n=1 Tax=Paludibacterium purpuratum TaxID=1144873 RepID=A0A4R7B580_9NEIS|nr:hypothetical protein [Paludibacterium purpuratum]TDR77935.1 hypothetical protein DFP86_109182 [Paludibacterium purpuratum]
MLFELLLLLLLLATTFAVVATAAMLILRRWKRAYQTIAATAATWLAYLATVAAVSAFTPQKILGMNDDLCFDEMCFAAVDFRLTHQLGPPDRPITANGSFAVVAIRVSSHSRGRTQSEGGLRARLWDGTRNYDEVAADQLRFQNIGIKAIPLTERLSPGQSVLSVQVFDVPHAPTPLQLVLDHGITPGYLVIGEAPWFKEPAVIALTPSKPASAR